MEHNGSLAGSLFLIALGAILTWAVSYRIAGIDIMIVGVVLLVVGILGLALSMLFWSSFAPYARRGIPDDLPRDSTPRL